MKLPATFDPSPDAPPYVPDPTSAYRVNCAFRVDFTNGGHIQGEDFLLDLHSDTVAPARLAEMIVSALNLLRAGPVTIHRVQVVRRGERDDA
jgi:hypothetical protein